MMKEDKLKETEIAEIANRFFSQYGWKMFPEVCIPVFPGRPDFMSTKHSLVAAIECKTSLSYPVIEQLARWPLYFEDVKTNRETRAKEYGVPHLLIAVTGKGGSHSSLMKTSLLKQYRIGHYTVSRTTGYYREYPSHLLRRGVSEGTFHTYGSGTYECCVGGCRYEVIERLTPKIQPASRKTAHRLAVHLDEDMMIGVAGASGNTGEYMTPFKRTMGKVIELLSDGEVWHIGAIVAAINKDLGGHHYCSDASAAKSLPSMILKLNVGESVEGFNGSRFVRASDSSSKK